MLDGLVATDVEVPEPWQLISVNETFDLVHTSVGKSNAAGATGAVLDPSVHGLVLSVGIAGALPGSGVELLDVVLASTRETAHSALVAEFADFCRGQFAQLM